MQRNIDVLHGELRPLLEGHVINEGYDGTHMTDRKPVNMSEVTINVGATDSEDHDFMSSVDYEIHAASHGFSSQQSSSSSHVSVNIRDFGGDSINLTSVNLRRCKEKLLRPYWKLLMLIGWRGFGKESIYSDSCRWGFLNFIYTGLIVLLLLYTYVYEAVACQWKLDVAADIHKITTPVPTTTTGLLGSTLLLNQMGNKTKPIVRGACEHIATTYLIPNTLHFIAYIMGIIHFRLQENEESYALMEKVFLQASSQQFKGSSQDEIITKIRIYFVIGALWVFSTLGLQGLYEWAFDFPSLDFFDVIGKEGYWIMLGLEMCGTLVINSIILAVILNYVIHCEMILFYIRGLARRLEDRDTDLKTAMKDFLLMRENMSLINGPIARMTSMMTVILAELSVIGMSIIVLNRYNTVRIWSYRCTFTLIWFLMFMCPLIQAAKVNTVGRRLKNIALEIRVNGYRQCSQLDLDSFLDFVRSFRFRAKLFHMPIYPSYLVAGFVVAAFVILILLQNGVIGPSNHIF